MSLAEEAQRLRDEYAFEREQLNRREAERVAVTVVDEVVKAMDKFDAFNSPHEGWAVIREELDELWEHVRANTGRADEARVEAIQIAAMAFRYVLDLTGESDA